MTAIGIDLGGTNIAVGVVDEKGRILGRATLPTQAKRPFQDVVADMARAVRAAADNAGVDMAQVRSIGCGVPGLYDEATGLVLFCTNLGWTDVPLREEMARHFSLPFFCDNDAAVAALAEATAGKSAGVQSSALLTLGTGLGGGFIMGGRVFSGSHGVASEIGHSIYCTGGAPCTCGRRGCLERYASASGLIRIGLEAALRHPDSALRCIAPEKLGAKHVIDAARAGDVAGVEAFNEYTTHLAAAINMVINFLDPEMILLGGGVAQAGDFLLEPVRCKVAETVFYRSRPFAQIELAALGNDAGIIGAAMLGRP